MKRWQAITEIVSTFVNRGHPGYALAALGLILVSGIATLLLAYTVGAPMLGALK